MNLYKFLGLVYEFLLPVVAYLDFPPMSGKEFTRFVVVCAIGTEVVPVLWHCSTTSLKATYHKSFFPPIPPLPNTSLSRLNDDFPLTPLEFIAGGGEDDTCFDPFDVLAPGVQGLSSNSTLEGFGKANCRTLSNPSMRAKTSLVLSRSSF